MTVTHWVYSTVLSYVQNHEDAEEVIQDTLLATLNGLMAGEKATNRFKSESSLKTWVFSIAINKSKDVLKYRGRKKRDAHVISLHKNDNTDQPTIEPATFIHPGVELEDKEQMQLLFDGINQLPEKQKQALIMAKFEQMPMKEIAVIMKTTPKAVESLLSRARSNFKNYLDVEGIKIFKRR